MQQPTKPFCNNLHFYFATFCKKGLQKTEYGDPTYSGVYFRRIKWAKNTKMVIPVSEMNSQKINPGIPADFDEQTLETKRISIGRMLPVQEGLLFTGPETLIYDCGKYCAPEDKEKPEF